MYYKLNYILAFSAILALIPKATAQNVCTSVRSPVFDQSVVCVPHVKQSGEAHDLEFFHSDPVMEQLKNEDLWDADLLHKGPPQLGIALSGGGTRAASFAMGVLAQLDAAGVLQHANAISSVSGGGYSAYFYYSKLLQRRRNIADGVATFSPHEIFSDRLWRPYLDELLELQSRYGDDPQIKACAELIDDEHPDRWNEFVERCTIKLGKSEQKQDGQRSIDQQIIGTSLTIGDVFQRRDNYALDHKNHDDMRFQFHVSAWRDVLAPSDDEPESAEKASLRNPPHLTGQVFSPLGAETIVSMVPHFISDTLFDWKWDSSPSQVRYQNGIHRTYGINPVARPDDCLPDGSEEANKTITQHEKRLLDVYCLYDKSHPKAHGTVEERVEQLQPRVDFSGVDIDWPSPSLTDLKRAYLASRTSCAGVEECVDHMPFWIINTSKGKGGMEISSASNKAKSFYDMTFEFTSTGFGSGDLGFINISFDQSEETRNFSLLSATAASAAFLDPQQETYGKLAKMAVAAFLHNTNAEWGLDIPNYRVAKSRRTLHRLLPFPFYYLDGYIPGQEGAFVHVSDGGQEVDNLGAYALIRRGFKQIVIVDAGADREGKLEDVCYLRSNLARKDNLHLESETLPLEKICGNEMEIFKPDVSSSSVSPFRWKNKVVKMKVTGLPSALANGGTIDIYYIKQALDLEYWFPCLGEGENSECHIPKILSEQEEAVAKKVRGCTPATIGPSRIALKDRLPCSLDIFAFDNLGVTNGGWKHEFIFGKTEECDRPSFPQHGTVSSTSGSSRPLYYAYRDLGAYAARDVQWAGDHIENLGQQIKQPLSTGLCENQYFPEHVLVKD
jgi:hypothetical protein